MTHQASSSAERRETGVDPRLPVVGGLGTRQRHERHQHDRRERRERDVDLATRAIDHVERAGDPVDEHPAVQERVGEVEEVATAGVVFPVREPVDEERDEGDADAHDGREATEVEAGAGGHGVESSPSASGGPAGFGTARSRL